MAPDSQSNPSFTRDSSTMKQMTATYQGAGHPVVWYIGRFCYVESTDGNPMALELSQLQELVISLVDNQQESCLIIGFDKSSHVGSAMMGLLIKMYKIISDDDGRFGVIVRNENTLKSFKIVKLDTMMPIFSSLRNLLTEMRFGPESEVHLEPMD